MCQARQLLLLLLVLLAAPLVSLGLEGGVSRRLATEEASSNANNDSPLDDREEDADLENAKRFLKMRKRVCYGDLGCFSITGKYFSLTRRPVVVLPQSPEEINTKFLLFTRLNKASPHSLIYNNADSVLRSKFSSSRPTKLIIHGFLGDGILGWMNRIRQAMLKRVDCNVIQVG